MTVEPSDLARQDYRASSFGATRSTMNSEYKLVPRKDWRDSVASLPMARQGCRAKDVGATEADNNFFKFLPSLGLIFPEDLF